MRKLLSILFAICAALALLPTAAFADDAAEPTATPQSGVLQSIVAKVLETALPITSIGPDALFQHQYQWEAVDNQDFGSANEDGSLSEWQLDWFISHDWSDYGRVIADLQPGDAVTVNGQTILILGRDQWPNEAINWDIYDIIGWDKTVFQTCLGDYAIWIAYGIPVYPTKDFLASHAA